MKAANELVDIIRDIVQQEIDKRSDVTLCQVQRKKDQYHYDLMVVPDTGNIISNVTNMTMFELSVGDYVYVYRINGQLNNSFICYKLMPYIGAPAVSGSGAFSLDNIKTINLEMNHFKINRNVNISFLLRDFNTNSANKNFLTERTDFSMSQARPYYAIWFPYGYWMFGKANPSGNVIGNLGINTSDTRVLGGSLEISNGFTLNGSTHKVASDVPGFTLAIECLDTNDVLISTTTQVVAPILQGTDPNDVPKYDITLPFNGDKVIKTISFRRISAFGSGARFNVFNFGFEYKDKES